MIMISLRFFYLKIDVSFKIKNWNWMSLMMFINAFVSECWCLFESVYKE